MQYTDIRFPNLGINLSHVGRYIAIGDFQIMYYGIIIACGFFAGLLVAQKEARRTGQNPEIYLDYLLCMVVPAILGARAYYVIFSWDYYKANPGEILNIRGGGLGIVGGVMAAILVLVIFAKVRKQKLLLMLDTLTMGLLIGQSMGRWGNFFNREAFGGFTDGLFSMQIPVEYFERYGRVGELSQAGLLEHLVDVTAGGQTVSCIQVHPTFLYEGLWNLALLIFLLLFLKHRRFKGEIFFLYLAGYGIGRAWIEAIRTDQLYIGNTSVPVNMVMGIALAAAAILAIALISIRKKKNENKQDTEKNE